MKRLLLFKHYDSNRIKQVNINNIIQPLIYSYSLNNNNINKRYFSDDNHDGDNGKEKNKYIAPTLTGLTIEQIIKVSEKNNYLRTKHIEIEGNLNIHDKDIVRRKRMIYRSKQRGWLEADILLGSWAVLHVPSLSIEELDEYEIILNEETIDVFNYVTGKDKLPSHLENLKVMKDLQRYALQSNINNPEAYAEIKKGTNLT